MGEFGLISLSFFQSYGIAFRKAICCPQPVGCCDECCDEECGASGLTSKYGGFFQAIKPGAWQVDFIGGWRNYRLEEWTTVTESLVVEVTPPGTAYIPGSTFDVSDAFETENVFNGAELGLSARRCHGRWSLDLLAKVGLGSQTQTARINGGTILATPAGDTAIYDAGILALDSNIGHYSRNKFVCHPTVWWRDQLSVDQILACPRWLQYYLLAERGPFRCVD